jgi:hypothetical protein
VERTGRGGWPRREHKDGPETWETHASFGAGLANPPAPNRPKARETEPVPTEAWESEGRVGAMTSANVRQAEPTEQRRHVSGVSFRRER